jgi:hypothetical protein
MGSKKRITIADIKKHSWFNDKYLEGKDLIRALRDKHREMEHKRRKDAKKIQDLQHSIKVNRNLPLDGINVKLFPEDQIESIADLYTTCDWKDVYSVISGVVGESGVTELDKIDGKLVCVVKITNPDLTQVPSLVKFEVQIFKSREYIKQKKVKTEDEDENEYEYEQDNEQHDEMVYVVRFKRIQGDMLEYCRAKKICD